MSRLNYPRNIVEHLITQLPIIRLSLPNIYKDSKNNNFLKIIYRKFTTCWVGTVICTCIF